MILISWTRFEMFCYSSIVATVQGSKLPGKVSELRPRVPGSKILDSTPESSAVLLWRGVLHVAGAAPSLQIPLWMGAPTES